MLFFSNVNADHENDLGRYYFSQVPALCGTPKQIDNYMSHYNMKPYHISLGREGMVETGQPVYMVTYYISEENGQSLATVDVPNQKERCILFHTFDLTKPN